MVQGTGETNYSRDYKKLQKVRAMCNTRNRLSDKRHVPPAMLQGPIARLWSARQRHGHRSPDRQQGVAERVRHGVAEQGDLAVRLSLDGPQRRRRGAPT